MTKSSLKSIVISDSMRNVFANLISLPFSLISSLLIARILGPELTGITAAAIMLVLTYTSNAHLGTINALGQRYPFLIGQGSTESKEEAQRMLGVILGFVTIGGIGAAFLVLGLAFWQFMIGSRLMAVGLCFGAIITVLQLYKTYYLFVIRSTHQFEYWSHYTIIFFWVPLAWVLAARFGGVIAQWAALCATELIMCFTLYRKIGHDIKFKLDFKASWQYIKLGFPIYAVASLFSIFTTIDKLTATLFLGTTALGFYGVASMAATFLGIIPAMIAQIMWPRMAEKLGTLEQDWPKILPYIEKPTFLMAYLLPILIGIVILAIPPVTKLLLPKYVQGIKAAQISIITVYFLGLMGMYTTFLGTSLRLLPYGIVAVLGIGLNLIGSYLSVHFGWGLVGIAWAKVFAFGVVAILLFGYVERLFKRQWKEIILRILVLLTPMFTVYLLAFWIIPWLIPSNAICISGRLCQLSYQLIILALVTGPLAWFALHSSGVMGEVGDFFCRSMQSLFRTRIKTS